MNRIKLCITRGGNVRGLWTDQVDWRAIGRVRVRRASSVEFHDSIQKWVVRAWRPRSRVGRVLQWLTGRPFGEILHMADTRERALTWEQAYYGVSGPGWRELQIRSQGSWIAPLLEIRRSKGMSIIESLMNAMNSLFGARHYIRGHDKSQAYGSGWSRHRPRKIQHYTRRRPRSFK